MGIWSQIYRAIYATAIKHNYINEIFDYCILKCNSIVLLTRLVLEYDPFYYTQLDKKFKQNLLLILYFVLLYSLPCSLWVIGHRVELLC